MRNGGMAFALMCLFVLAMILIGCASKPSVAPEPRVIPVDVPRIVEVKCKDARPPREALPDDDDKLAQVRDDDFELLAKIYRAARQIYRAQLAIDDVQIKGCAQE